MLKYTIKIQNDVMSIGDMPFGAVGVIVEPCSVYNGNLVVKATTTNIVLDLNAGATWTGLSPGKGLGVRLLPKGTVLQLSII